MFNETANICIKLNTLLFIQSWDTHTVILYLSFPYYGSIDFLNFCS